MKRLKRIGLINWHRFTQHTFDVEGHLLLMGDNGSGKSTILDALQVGLVGNMRSVRLNLAANEGGDRSLKSYVLGLVGGGTNGQPPRTLRKNATAYILLEFGDSESDESLVLGTVIDAHADGRSPDKEHFIAKDAHLEDCPCLDANNAPRTVREFKREIQQHKNIKRYARVEEYQQALLRQLGGLDPEFFRLFVSGMAFRKIRHLRDFVYDFLLPEASEVQVASLREAAEKYRQLHELSKEAEARIDLLDRIVANAQTATASRKEADGLRCLIERGHLASSEAAARTAADNQAKFQKELAEATEQHTHAEAAHQTARETLTRLQHDLAAHEKQTAALAVENRVERLADQIRHENKGSERLEQALRASRTALAAWQRLLEEPAALQTATHGKPKTWREELAESFGPEAAIRLEDFDGLAADCLAGEIPPPDRKNFVRRVAEDWPAMGHWLQSRRFQVEAILSDFQTERQAAHEELLDLHQGHRPLPPGLMRLQQQLETAGVSSSVFCEVIEVSDPALQELIEAVLGPRRYDLLVPPELFETALSVFRAAEESEASPFGLVETPRLMRSSVLPAERSLAQAIDTHHALARKYADAVLGRAFAVSDLSSEDAQSLDGHSLAVAEDGLVRQGFAIRRLPAAADHQTWQIGGGGLSGRREALQNTLKDLRSRIRRLAELRGQLQTTHELFDRGRRGPELLAEDYELPARLQDIRQEYAQAREESAALRESDLGELRQMVEVAEEAEHRAAKELKLAWGRQCVAEQSLKTSETALAEAKHRLAEVRSAYKSHWAADSEIAVHCETIFAEQASDTPIDDLVRGWTEQLNSLQKSFSERHDDGVRLRTEYNNRFQFAADCIAEDIAEYADERERWVESELPRYESQLANAQETARQVLEEEVIHRLRERLRQVERQFRELNRALEGLDFSGRRYRFTYAVRREFQAFYDMVVAAEAIADEPLHQSDWHARFAEGPLKDLLDDVLGAGGNRALANLEHCTDYRAYFDYDIEITEADGTQHAFSHVAGSGSGGETQTPYYVAMLASLARVYRTKAAPGSRAALVAFDEPFQKMDESNIAATLELARRLGLQVLLAAPKDRCHQLLPAMGTATCLLVLRDGNRVLVEPFQRLGEDWDSAAAAPDIPDARLVMPTKPKQVK